MKLIHTQIVLSGVAVALLLGGCAKDPSKSVAKATVTEPSIAAAAEPAAAPTAAEPVKAEPAVAAATEAAKTADPAAATGYTALAGPAGAAALTGDIIFTGSKVTGSHSCKFSNWSGFAELEDGNAVGGSLAFRVDMSGIVADFEKPNDWSKKLEGHLKSAEFFDVARFATAEFSSTEITAGGEGGATHTIAGKLSLHGVTKDVTFPATVAVDAAAKTVSGTAEFSINRKDFGIEYPGKPDDLIRDGVVLKIVVKGTLP